MQEQEIRHILWWDHHSPPGLSPSGGSCMEGDELRLRDEE